MSESQALIQFLQGQSSPKINVGVSNADLLKIGGTIIGAVVLGGLIIWGIKVLISGKATA